MGLGRDVASPKYVVAAAVRFCPTDRRATEHVRRECCFRISETLVIGFKFGGLGARLLGPASLTDWGADSGFLGFQHVTLAASPI